ncbi:bone morphogenetic protein 8B-like [Oenanthe melanoleuca]|uniref:bone morphogenetic protein 8B-like n=1 Tax=Oenanthe melanoleuca TaxID=2939378 RepID=UPI0024C1D05C|nr:bone morphogenetic protein 8B-like [Oenanthe melanoleuca]
MGRGAGGGRRGAVALLWVAAVLCQLGSGSVLRRRLHSAGVPQRRLSGGERRDVQREILAVLGLPGRPRPRGPARAPAAAAPLFMLDLYHAVAGEEEEGEDGEEAAVSRPVLTGLSTQSPPPGSVVSRADTVVSLVNMVEQDRDLQWPEPYWKEFRLDLAQLPAGEAVTAAEFRIHKGRGSHGNGSGSHGNGSHGNGSHGNGSGSHGNGNLRISVYEVSAGQPGRESELLLLDVQDLRAGAEGWLVFDVTASSSRWSAGQKHSLGLRLYVETEDGQSVDPGSAGLLGRRGPRSKQPFMVTFFRASPSPARVTRAAKPPRRRQPKKSNDLPHPNKLPGIFGDVHPREGRQVCRRHELYVSFQDLGWLDWVIAPQGYSAYYCDGECAFPLDSCMNATNHAILQSLVHLMKPEAVPKACCAPTKLSATSVLYYDSNNNVILKKHRNMVVKSCGCH